MSAPERPRIRLRGPVIDTGLAGDALDPAVFYERLLGWPVVESAPGGWAKLESSDGLKIEIQGTHDYQPPIWPTESGAQQMMLHLDFATDDLDAAVAWAVDAGADDRGASTVVHRSESCSTPRVIRSACFAATV